MLGESTQQLHHVVVLQEDEPPIAVVIGECSERLGSQCDLRVQFERSVEQ